MLNSGVELIEDDEDEIKISPTRLSDAVIYSTDWTTETILNQIRKGNIDINPRFQRRDAWNIIKKSRFIESIILGLPIPQIVLAENKKDRGKYIVIDGKQRLLTLLQFTSKEGKKSNFKLKDLEIREDLVGKSFSDLEMEIELESDLNQFSNQTIRSVVIRNWPDNNFLHIIFVRLNTNSVKLSSQELRQALFPGDFTQYIDDAACESYALRTLLKISEPDFRMRDVEILLRYMAFSFFISEYNGNLKEFLDSTCENLNRNWTIKQNIVKEKIEVFEESMKASIEIFGKDVGRKWTSEGFETRLNRAIVDVVIYYFSDKRIRDASLEKKVEVLKAFKSLCIGNENFRSSIETTTKSLGSTSNRFILWGEELRKVLDLEFRIPIREGDRIKFSGFWE